MSCYEMILPNDTIWQPLAHVAMRNDVLRMQLVQELRTAGWAAIESQSGYHLLRSINEPLLGDEVWWKPELIVVDAFSPGCSGLTLAHGMRELDWHIPVLLVVHSDEHRSRVKEDVSRAIYVAESSDAAYRVVEIARHHARPSRWSCGLTDYADSSVAQPQSTPSSEECRITA